MNDSVFNLFLFVNRNHYVIITALLHVYYCRRFLDNEETIHKRILQNSPRKKNSTKPTHEKRRGDGEELA